jgi:phosphoribosylanthranilate isomerase
MVRVKICGLSRLADIEAVNRALPDYAGFVFARSRRRVDIAAAGRLREKLAPGIQAVGVFADEVAETVAEIYRKGIIDIAQLHGGEDGEYIRRLKGLCGCAVIKAVAVGRGGGGGLPDVPEGADFLLFDAPSPGGGRAFDWNVLRGYGGAPYFLAGGLTPENVTDALNVLSPYCVDVSSGVETDGVKDADKVAEFVRTVRGRG